MIIIPDIHGRKFWKDAVKGHETEPIIFLGDYVDPYSFSECIENWRGYTSLLDVIQFKEEHPDNVTLLLGNHDLSYITQHVYKCRHDDENHYKIRDSIRSHLSFFDIAYEQTICDRRFIFTHAGILMDWMRNNEFIFSTIRPGNEVSELNRLFHEGLLYPVLGDVSTYRGGVCDAGSCVWADVHEHLERESAQDALHHPLIYQIFGHTQQQPGEPLITPHFACLDCRHAFHLNEQGELQMI